ncbi:hypothetical protein KJ359_004010 [Pestalotiopsis sp. 9143b]|nr:hypothetical protein KJ359_004010 [Pestalotiopsis sp. 9143b]
MARTRDEPAEDEDQEMDEELVALQFDEPLSWRAGKPIPTGTLLSRLEKLSKELVELDQDTVDKESLTKVAKELAASNLLAHKEGGVKAYTASCLVDVLKLCAPDAPFTPTQLKEIFGLFVKTILPSLWDPTHTYNTQHKYVLTSLAEVKSILLINELSNAEDLLLHLFSSFFDGISGSSKSSTGEQVAKDVEFHMTDILVTLLEEGPTLPPSVLDVIMAQFLRAAPPGGSRARSDANGSQTTLLPKEEPEAYVMAKTVCNHCPEKMARYVSQYFSDVIMDISGKGGSANGQRDDDSDNEEGTAGPSESDFKELRKAHQLLRELWRAAPTVLQNVVPQLDAELSADNVQLRLLATETLGDMISGIGAAGPPPPPVLDPAAYPPIKIGEDTQDQTEFDSILTTPLSPLSFATTHTQVFHNFVSRRHDKSPLIRAVWTTAVGYIVSTSAGGIGLSREDEQTFIEGLKDRLNDADEKVRLAAVKAIEVFRFRDIVTKLALEGGVEKNGTILANLSDRCRDRRAPIRVAAMALLAKLWAAASGELMAGNDAVISALGAIPTHIFSTFYANDLELNILLERVTFECLVPLSYPPPKPKQSNSNSQSQANGDGSYDPDRIRAERILLLVKSLDEKSTRAFFAMQQQQPQFAKLLQGFVKQCENFNGGLPETNGPVVKQNLKKIIQYLVPYFPDAVKVEADLYNFATLNDRRCYALTRFITSHESDFKTMHRGLKEFIKRIQGTSKPHVLDTMLPLLYRAAYIIINKSHLPTFIDCSKNDKEGFGTAAQQITSEASKSSGALFKAHIGQLCKDLIEAAPSASKENEPGTVETLKACSSYSLKYPEELPQDKKFIQALINYALHGTPAKAAKYAVNILMARKDDKSLVSATELLQKITKSWGWGSPHFLSKIAAVAQLELLASTVTADANDKIMDMALKEVLQKVRTAAAESDDDAVEWVDDAELEEECFIKCSTLKLIVNRLRGTKDAEEVKDVTPTVFKLLRTLIRDQGELCKTQDTPKHHKSRLRLLAGQLLLKLCTERRFEELFPHSDFNKLSLLTQDSCARVRRGFVEKLQKYLVNRKLPARFYTIIFLTAFEPEKDFKLQTETWIRSRARYFRETSKDNVNVMEAIFGRLISLLAHHPDFSPEADDLLDTARYIIHYVSNVSTEQNFGLIFKYAERVKQTRDGIAPEKSDNLYVLCDLALAVLRKWQERKGWSFQAYSGKTGLPKGLYAALPSHDAAQQIAEKQYLPEDVEERLDDLLRTIDKKKKRRSMDDRGDGHPAQKRARTAKPRTSTARADRPAGKRPAVKTKTAKSRKPARSSPAPESADRRRSGRSRKDSSYLERDSSDDDDDMLDGVAKWEYFDKEGNRVADDDEDEDEDEDNDQSELSEVEEEAEPMEDDAEPEAEPEVEPEAEEEAEAEAEAEDSAANEEVEAADEDDKPEESVAEEETLPIRSSGRRGRSAATAASPAKTKAAPSPASKTAPSRSSASRSKAPAKSATPPATSTRSTRSRRAA